MFAPANPPRVASNVAPVTRVSVRAARGIEPAAMFMPVSVFRFEPGPDPRIDGPLGVSVTLGMVPAMALRSPAMVGEICPLMPSCHFSDDPGSGCVGFTALLADRKSV